MIHKALKKSNLCNLKIISEFLGLLLNILPNQTPSSLDVKSGNLDYLSYTKKNNYLFID